MRLIILNFVLVVLVKESHSQVSYNPVSAIIHFVDTSGEIKNDLFPLRKKKGRKSEVLYYFDTSRVIISGCDGGKCDIEKIRISKPDKNMLDKPEIEKRSRNKGYCFINKLPDDSYFVNILTFINKKDLERSLDSGAFREGHSYIFNVNNEKVKIKEKRNVISM